MGKYPRNSSRNPKSDGVIDNSALPRYPQRTRLQMKGRDEVFGYRGNRRLRYSCTGCKRMVYGGDFNTKQRQCHKCLLSPTPPPPPPSMKITVNNSKTVPLSLPPVPSAPPAFLDDKLSQEPVFEPSEFYNQVWLIRGKIGTEWAAALECKVKDEDNYEIEFRTFEYSYVITTVRITPYALSAAKAIVGFEFDENEFPYPPNKQFEDSYHLRFHKPYMDKIRSQYATVLMLRRSEDLYKEAYDDLCGKLDALKRTVDALATKQ